MQELNQLYNLPGNLSNIKMPISSNQIAPYNQQYNAVNPAVVEFPLNIDMSKVTRKGVNNN